MHLSYSQFLNRLTLTKDVLGRPSCLHYVRSFSTIAQNTTRRGIATFLQPFLILDKKFTPSFTLAARLYCPVMHLASSLDATRTIQGPLNRYLSSKSSYNDSFLLPIAAVDWISNFSLTIIATIDALAAWVDLQKEFRFSATLIIPKTAIFFSNQAAHVMLIAQLGFSILQAAYRFHLHQSLSVSNRDFFQNQDHMSRAVDQVARTLLACMITFVPLPPISQAILQIGLTSWQAFDWRISVK